ncbi:hypothetical protein FACS1894189_8410 [Planctomycetales bacterium]|nr:hypothetical protein FACS1894189_8410 [Planctomycetales bacterium]
MTQDEKITEAQTALLDGDLLRAEKLYREALLNEKNTLCALDGLGVLNCRRGDSAQGIQYFEEALQILHKESEPNPNGEATLLFHLGLLSCFMIQLYMAYEIWAILSLVLVTKMCDIGAYTIGKLLGRHKMTPGLSPGKTIEGAVGGILFACAGSWLWFNGVMPCFNAEHLTPLWGWLLFGITIALAGMVGDLAGSLIKRDSNMKDSGHAVPGFGGFLDIFDSLLIAAPAAYVFWAFGFVCPGNHL